MGAAHEQHAAHRLAANCAADADHRGQVMFSKYCKHCPNYPRCKGSPAPGCPLNGAPAKKDAKK